ncbi:hypothetical protein Tco_1576271 [Tanacetum coccineum]
MAVPDDRHGCNHTVGVTAQPRYGPGWIQTGPKAAHQKDDCTLAAFDSQSRRNRHGCVTIKVTPIYDHSGITAMAALFLQNILDLYFKYFKLPEDVVNRILQVVLDLQHFKSSLVIFAATILQSSSAIHHISNIDNFVHQIIEFQSILITSSPLATRKVYVPCKLKTLSTPVLETLTSWLAHQPLLQHLQHLSVLESLSLSSSPNLLQPTFSGFKFIVQRTQPVSPAIKFLHDYFKLKFFS